MDHYQEKFVFSMFAQIPCCCNIVNDVPAGKTPNFSGPELFWISWKMKKSNISLFWVEFGNMETEY